MNVCDYCPSVIDAAVEDPEQNASISGAVLASRLVLLPQQRKLLSMVLGLGNRHTFTAADAEVHACRGTEAGGKG